MSDLPEANLDETAIEEAYRLALEASELAGIETEPVPELDVLNEQVHDAQDSPETVSQPAQGSLTQEKPAARHTPQQIIEALLFVGGETLSAKRLANILGERVSEEQIRDWIEDISQRYESQQRPYEIELGDHGYQMSLKEEFESQRDRLYGLGPREVRLSQDALELISFIAYQQPVSESLLKRLDKENIKSVLNQLIRRNLVAVERPESDEDEISYSTTDRFLTVFGLNSLEDLPRAADLNFK